MDSIKNYVKSWDVIRLIRLVFGIVVIIEGIRSGEWLLIMAGSLFSLMPLMNVGCCASSNCNVPLERARQGAIENTTYEEIR